MNAILQKTPRIIAIGLSGALAVGVAALAAPPTSTPTAPQPAAGATMPQMPLHLPAQPTSPESACGNERPTNTPTGGLPVQPVPCPPAIGSETETKQGPSGTFREAPSDVPK